MASAAAQLRQEFHPHFVELVDLNGVIHGQLNVVLGVGRHGAVQYPELAHPVLRAALLGQLLPHPLQQIGIDGCHRAAGELRLGRSSRRG